MSSALRVAVLLCALPALCASAAEMQKRLDAGRSYWAFQPPSRTDPPQIASPWIKTPVDAFILAGLQKKGLEPSPPLEKIRLLRRVYLDLTGLPPTPGQADAFLRDESPRAYQDLVDRLLESPHYGERWALKWLDVVRHADTNGFELDGLRTHAWRYRDYVVRSFNSGKPYDRFVQEQLAGDEMFPGDADALIATGFLGAGPRHIVGGNLDEEMTRQEVLTEMTDSAGAVFLGLTVGCAKCHDHKFDPIAQADYYRLQAVFAATDLKDRGLAPLDEIVEWEKAVEDYKAKLDPIKRQLEELEKPYRDQVIEAKKAKLEPEFRRALEIPETARNEEQQRLAKEASGQIRPMWYEVVDVIPDGVKKRRQELRNRMHAIELEEPSPPRAAYAVANMAGDPPPTHILKVGDHRYKMEEVGPGFPGVLDSLGVDMPQGAEGRRAALAKWLTRPGHPLTARVMVSRIWEFRMGGGLVGDPNNFGLMGGSPPHPELLDYLAAQFVESGWSVKAIDRVVLLSNAYRQSAAIDPAKAEKDPDNKRYWRANRRRLEGETIRDNILAASGQLNAKIGGEPVLIPIEPEIYDLIFTEAEPDNLWPVTPDEAEHRRRSIYLLNKRTVRLPFLANFDQPDAMTSCAVRSTSTHALQALTLLNSDFMQEQSKALADRVASQCGADRSCQIGLAYRLALARPPDSRETDLVLQFLETGENRLSDFCLALLNRNEFVYRP